MCRFDDCLYLLFPAVDQEMMALIPLSDKRLRPRRTWVFLDEITTGISL